jgi:hypothetical protein
VDDASANQAARLCDCHWGAVLSARVHHLGGSRAGITLRFKGQGVDEKAFAAAISGHKAPALTVGDCIVSVDLRYFRLS